MTKYVLGIDPGLAGGIVLYRPDNRKIISTIQMPVKQSHRKGKREVDAQRLAQWLESLPENCKHCYIEQVSGRPGQAGQFQFGVNVGMVTGVVQSFGIDTIQIPANVWKANYHLHRQPGETDSAWKKRSIAMANKIFPDVNFNNSDGVAEAALIAFFGEHSK